MPGGAPLVSLWIAGKSATPFHNNCIVINRLWVARIRIDEVNISINGNLTDQAILRWGFSKRNQFY